MMIRIRWIAMMTIMVSTSSAGAECTALIESAFEPEGDASALIVRTLNRAQRQIRVQAFSFTHRAIAAALVRAQQRGVDVQIIIDAEQWARLRPRAVRTLAAAGVPLFTDSQHRSAHNKIIVTDAGTPQATVVTGSFNFTEAARRDNAENVVAIHAPDVAMSYLKNWQVHRAHAQAFDNKY